MVQQDYSEIIQKLEALYSERRLKFTTSFQGAVPVQAYGLMDGLRFYFRYRHDVGSLGLGHFDLHREQTNSNKAVLSLQKRFAEKYADFETGGITQTELDAEEKWHQASLARARQIPAGEEDNFYPTIFDYEGIVENYSGDEFGGWLLPEEAFDLFIQCVENLVPMDNTI